MSNNIYVIMGFSKSGTTLTAKTLHESGIDMHPGREGTYKQSKYEDPEIVNILLDMFNAEKLKSLLVPDKIKWDRNIRDRIKKLIASRSGEWGFKQPWVTLCYPEFKSLLPPHTAIGIKRSFESLMTHWTKRREIKDMDKFNCFREKVRKVWTLYNAKMELYNIPVISFERFLDEGPKQLEKIVGRKLKDVRV